MIFDADNWREIGATLGRNKTRTFLTGFGIFWGTAMLALLLGGADGLQGLLMRNFAGFATNMAGIFPQNTTESYRGFNKGSVWQLSERDIDLIKQRAPDIVESIAGVTSAGVTATRGDKSLQVQVIGSRPEYFNCLSPIVMAGRLFNEADLRRGEKVAVIGKNVATSLFGGEEPTGQFVNAGGLYVKVIGVVAQRSDIGIGGRLDDSLIIPSSTMTRAWGLGDKVQFAILTLRGNHRLDELKPVIQRVVCSNHPISPTDTLAVGYMDIAAEFEKVSALFLAVSLLAGFVGGGTLIAGIIGVGNIMWIIVKERTGEIGIRRAIGARPVDIIAMVLAEGVVLTMVAGLAGISFSTIVLAIVDHLTAKPGFDPAGFGLQLPRALAILGVFTVLGTLAGLIPAMKAMRVKPVEAINDK